MKKIIATLLLLVFAFGYNIPSYAAYEEIDPMGLEVYENNMTRDEYYSQSIAQYSEYDFSDPQTTTDEELYGVWNNSAGVWTLEPLLDYENKPALAEIEEAAKNADGDYTLCKELTLEYYREKFDGFNTSISANVTNKNKLSAEMRFENWNTRPAFGQEAMSKLLVSKNPGWISATVLDAVKPIVASPDKRVTIHLYSLKKDGYTAIFDSKEADNAPYIEATVNGVARKFYPQADTYASAGNNSGINYSAESKLLAEESVSSIGTVSAVDEYTRRSVLKFDFSSINDNDEVTSAVLHIYGHMEKSDNPEDSEIEKNSKIVFVLNDNTVQTWEEESLTWDNYFKTSSWVCLCYDGQKGYTNEAISEYYPNVQNYRASIMSFAHELRQFTQYYYATGDEVFAWHILRESMHKIRELNCEYASTEQPTLNLIRVQDLIQVMDTLRYSEHMTPEIFVTFLKNCYEHAEAIVGSERFKDVRDKIWHVNVKTGNVGALQTQALLEVAVVFDEFKAADAPLGEVWRTDTDGLAYNGGWKAVAKTRFEQCIAASTNPDGSASDIPLNYVWTNIRNYIEPLRDYQAYYNYDVTSILGDDIKEMILQTGEYVMRMLNPLRATWAVGDGGSYNAKQDFVARHMMNLWPNDVSELLKYIGSNGKMGSLPEDFTSCASDIVNRAVLRSDWSENAVALHFQSNSNNKHTHSDDLSIVMLAYGNYVLADMLRYTYSTNDEISNWQTMREAHNSIVVDGRNAAKTGGSLHPEDREFNNVYDFIYADSAGYENQFMTRYICFIKPGYYIVTDHVESADEKEHNYRQNWHFQPTANITVNEYGQTQTQFKGKANLTVVAVADNGELAPEICDGYYSATSNVSDVTGTKYVSYNKNTVGDTSFQTLLYPTQVGENVDIQTEVLQTSISAPDARAMRAVIKDSNSRETVTNYYILMDETKKEPAAYGDFKTDGIMSLSEYINEDLSTLILRKGSYIENTASGRKLLVSPNEVEDVGISIDNTRMDIESTKESLQDLNGLTIYVGNKTISSVTFNKEEVTFGKSGSYVYVGNAPAYTLPAEEEQEEDKTQDSDDSTYVPKEDGATGSIGGGGGGGGSTTEKVPVDKEEETVPDNNDSTDNTDVNFNDTQDHWAEESIKVIAQKGIVLGDEKGNFNPDNNITRAELVAIAMRTLGAEDCEYDGAFSDVSGNDWYAQVVAQALKEGIISENSRFRPNDYVTREEMCKILIGVMNKLGKDTAGEENELTFADSKEISSWANLYVSQAVNAGIMNGMGENKFAPKGNATRAQAVTVIERILKD